MNGSYEGNRRPAWWNHLRVLRWRRRRYNLYCQATSVPHDQTAPASRRTSMNMNIGFHNHRERLLSGLISSESHNRIESSPHSVEVRSFSITQTEIDSKTSENMMGAFSLLSSITTRSSLLALSANTQNMVRNHISPTQHLEFDQARSAKEEEKRSNRKTYHVLLVDDVPLTRKMMRRALQEHGSVVDEAADGMQAIELVRASIESEAPYDVILMDYQMPKMNGPSAAAAIRRLGYIGIIIGVSGHVLEEDEDVFLSQGANRVVHKPLDPTKLNNILKGTPQLSFLIMPSIRISNQFIFSQNWNRTASINSVLKQNYHSKLMKHIVIYTINAYFDENDIRLL